MLHNRMSRILLPTVLQHHKRPMLLKIVLMAFDTYSVLNIHRTIMQIIALENCTELNPANLILYLEGSYRNFPLSTVVMLLGGVIWAVIPFDTIPDIIPVLGWIDDAAVVAGIVMTVQKDINDYLVWKKNQPVVEGDCNYE